MSDRSPGLPRSAVLGAPLGSLIREARKHRGLTQQELALEIGVSQPEIARWESGRVTNISLKNRHRLAGAGISRAALGLASFSLDKIHADLDAAIDETLRLGKPALGARLLAPDLSWLKSTWQERAAGNGRIGQEELSLLAQATFVTGLIDSLTLPNEGRSSLIGTLEAAEHFAYQLNNDESRIDVLSHALLVNGNERRKMGNYGDAEYLLSKAWRLAANGQVWRREAEVAGLLSYVQAARADKLTLKVSLKRCEAALQKAESVKVAELATGDSVFNQASFAEVQLRCALITQDKAWAKQLCRNTPSNLSDNYHWELYYSITRGAAQLWLEDNEGAHWLRLARDIAVRVGAVSQLQRILMTSYGLYSAECAALADLVRCDLERIEFSYVLPSPRSSQPGRHNLF